MQLLEAGYWAIGCSFRSYWMQGSIGCSYWMQLYWMQESIGSFYWQQLLDAATNLRRTLLDAAIGCTSKCGEPIGCSYWQVLGNAENLLDAAIGRF